MSNLYEQRFKELQAKNAAISNKLEGIQAIRKPILNELYQDGTLKGQQAPIEPEQLESIDQHISDHNKRLQQLSTYDYLKQVKMEHKQSNERVKVLQEQFKVKEKKWAAEEKKKKQSMFRKPVIINKEQLAIEKQKKEDIRQDKFIKEMMDRYTPFLHKDEALPKDQFKAQQLHEQLFQDYQQNEHQQSQQEKGFKQRQKKEFDIVHTRDSWNKQQSLKQNIPMVQDAVQKQQNVDAQQQIDNINNKVVQDKLSVKHQRIYYKILDEKQLLESKTLKKQFNYIINQIWKTIDISKSGYISKEEIITYFKEYPIFIDIFDLNWDQFKLFVIKVKALRRGLLNKVELQQILQDNNLKLSPQQIVSKLKLKPTQYEIPEFVKDEIQQNTQVIQVQQQKVEFPRDPDVDYEQLEQLTNINIMFNDLNFPQQSSIDYENRKLQINEDKPETKPKHKVHTQAFLDYNRQMNEMQQLYSQNGLNIQNDPEFLLH